jgi:hypothetical protein
MPGERVEKFKVPDDIKATIGRMIALQSLATDPGQRILLAASVMQWIRVGLSIKYGSWDEVPERYHDTFDADRDLWQNAMMQYGRGAEFWSHALLPCQDIADDMVHIAGVECLIDYRQFEYNMTEATYGKSAYQLEEESAREQHTQQLNKQPIQTRKVPGV